MMKLFDHQLAGILSSITYEGIAVVALGYNVAAFRARSMATAIWSRGAEGLATLGVVWESSLFPGRAAEGTALLRVFLGGSRRRDIVGAPQSVLIETARRELAAVMGIRADPRHTSVFGWPKAIARAPLVTTSAATTSAPGSSATRGWRCAARRTTACRSTTRSRAAAPPRALAGRLWNSADRQATQDRDIQQEPSHDSARSAGDVREPTTASFSEQLVYSWRILVGLTRTVAPIPRPLLPVIALSRARSRNRMWTAANYSSPLEPITVGQAGQLEARLSKATGEGWKVHAAYEFRQPLLSETLAVAAVGRAGVGSADVHRRLGLHACAVACHGAGACRVRQGPQRGARAGSPSCRWARRSRRLTCWSTQRRRPGGKATTWHWCWRRTARC